MAHIYNSDLSKELIRGAKIQTSKDSVPSQLAEKVVPVMEVNPRLLRLTTNAPQIASSTTGAKTVYTTPTNQDFYLTGFTFAYIKDATSDAATSLDFRVKVNGATLTLFSFPIITLTASSGQISVTLANPLKLDRNTVIDYTGTFTAGVCVRAGSATGFVDETSQA